MSAFQGANIGAVRSLGLSPLWTVQSGYTGAPANGAAGVDVAASVNASWQVQLRPQATTTAPQPAFQGRKFVLTVSGVNGGSDYTVTLDGTSVTGESVFGDTAADILGEIKAAIEANPTTNALVSCALDDVSDPPTLTVTGNGEADYTIGLSTNNDAASMAAVADPTSAIATFWVFPVTGPTANTSYSVGQQWLTIIGVSSVAISHYGGAMNIVAVNSAGRLYIQLSGLTGAGDSVDRSNAITYAARVVIGPDQGA